MSDVSKLTIAVGIFLAFHLLLAYESPVCAWGVDLLAFGPAWVRGIFFLAGGLLLLPHFRQFVLNQAVGAFVPFDFWGKTRRSYLSRVLFLLVGIAAFVGVRSAIHLLGDGYLYLRELPESVSRSGRLGNEPLALWLLKTLHQFGAPYWRSAEFTYRLYSYISGFLYLLLSLSVARLLGREHREKTIILCFLITPGFLQQFFGYVENYSLVFPLMLLYLLAGLHTLRGRWPLWAPSCLLGVLVPLHFTTVTLAPSLCILAFFRGHVLPETESTSPKARVKHKRNRPTVMLEKGALNSDQTQGSNGLGMTVLAIGLAPALTLIILRSLGFNPFSYARGLRGSHFLPILGHLSFLQQYHLFDPAHFFDFFNEQFLVAPSALLVLCTLRNWKPSLHPNRTFLISAALFPLLFTFIANPEIGAFRDWDILSFPALPLALWAALALLGQVQAPAQRLHAGLLICGATALHTLVWVGLNANPAPAEARFIHILKTGGLSPHGRSYGWEELGNYYRDRNLPEQAIRAYEGVLAATPENPRQWNQAGVQYAKVGRQQEALRAFQQALKINPNFADTHNNLGNLYNNLGQYQTALSHFQKAVALEPNLAEAYVNMGNSYYNLGQHQTAIDHYLKAVEIRPNFAEAYNNIGNIYNKLKQYEDAVVYYQKTVALKPDFADAYNNMGNACYSLGRTEEAKRCFRKFLELNPNDPRGPRIMAWLRANL